MKLGATTHKKYLLLSEKIQITSKFVTQPLAPHQIAKFNFEEYIFETFVAMHGLKFKNLLTNPLKIKKTKVGKKKPPPKTK